jgi:hypothetical protein
MWRSQHSGKDSDGWKMDGDGCCGGPSIWRNVMNIDRAVFAFAGLMVLISMALGLLVSPYWFLLTAFVGLNLLQSAFTGFCPAAKIFKKLGVREGCAFV